MNNTETNKFLQEGIAAAKAARQSAAAKPETARAFRRKAKKLLMTVVEQDETITEAWLWLSAVVSTPEEKLTCLNNVLELEPSNELAQRSVTQLKREMGLNHTKAGKSAIGRKKVAASRHQKCPFCGKSTGGTQSTCPHCQTPLVMECPTCNTLMDVEWSKCRECDQEMPNYRLGSVYFYMLAIEYQQHHRLSRALEALQVAENLNPNQPDLYRQMGEVLAALGRPAEALTTLEKAVKKEPEQIGPYLSLGKVLEQEGKWERAEAVYKAAMSTAPESSETYFALGDLQLHHGKLKEARNFLKRAIKLDSKHGQAWARLGRVQEGLDRHRAAVLAYHNAEKLLDRHSLEWQKVQDRLDVLDPHLPKNMASSWLELVRQLIGPILVIFIAATLDAGLRPWWIDWSGWLAVVISGVGAFMWVSAYSLPQNPLICLITGSYDGLLDVSNRRLIAGLGIVIWLAALVLILLPIGQSPGQPP